MRLPAVAGRPGAAYFTLHSGAIAATLTGVSASGAERAELHQSMTSMGAMASMEPVATVPVPAGGGVTFAPGGLHVMLFGLDPALRPGGQITLTLRFADNSTTQAAARLVAAGDPAP